MKTAHGISATSCKMYAKVTVLCTLYANVQRNGSGRYPQKPASKTAENSKG